MPFKYHQARRCHFNKPKNQPKRNWSDYNKKMKMRGDITIWLSHDVIKNWVLTDRHYDGQGAPRLYSDMAILTVHEIRQVFKLPLRQCEGFINALFKLMKVELHCPSFSTLSKRLKTLKLKRPFYRFAHANAKNIKAIAIDSTGLKCYGQDEWTLEKYGEYRSKRDWRKLHVAVDDYHIIQTAELTKRNIQDVEKVEDLILPIHQDIQQVTADAAYAAYDANRIYLLLQKQFHNVNIVIPPRQGSKYHKQHARMRNRNVEEIQCYGRTAWQNKHDYGNRNQSENAISRYKRILGNRLHAREFSRQQQEIVIGCSILNKMRCVTLGEVRQKFLNRTELGGYNTKPYHTA